MTEFMEIRFNYAIMGYTMNMLLDEVMLKLLNLWK